MANRDEFANLTLPELLSIGNAKSRREICLTTLYYLAEFNSRKPTVSCIKNALKSARISGSSAWNISDILGKSGHLVHRSQDQKQGSWELTETGRVKVETALGLELDSVEVLDSRKSLSDTLAYVADDLARDYLDEGIRCFAAGCLRATIVFVWSGAIRSLQEKAVSTDLNTFSLCLQKHDPKASPIKTIDDCSKHRDRNQLLAFRDMGLLDKAQWRALQAALDLRNDAGHPNKFKPGTNQVAAFLESVISVVFH